MQLILRLLTLFTFASIAFAGSDKVDFRTDHLGIDHPEIDNREIDLNYDAGFNPEDPMHRELLDILSSMPNMPAISEVMMDKQFFRPAFGPTLWRMILKPNIMKVLFIGQDGTHIAEGAGYTATAGFGGRVQDVAKWLGINLSAGFMNYSFFTITKQYGAFDVPFIIRDRSKNSNSSTGTATDKVNFGSFVDNETWLMTQDVDGLMAQKRNQLIDWIIRYNKESLKMIVLFGGAARDSIGTFVESKNGQSGVKTFVGTRYSLEQLKNIEVPLGKLVSAGSNHVANVLLNKDGKDLYAEILGRPLNYKDESKKDLLEVQKIIQARISELENQMAITQGGVEGSGLIHPAQLGGYDLDQIQIGSEKQGRNLKGLPLSDGTFAGDILVTSAPHPTRLSMMSKEQASQEIAKAFDPLREEFERIGHIPADDGFINQYEQHHPYVYARTQIPIGYYTAGTPSTRMLDRSDAYRLKPDIVVLGTRDQTAKFDQAALNESLEIIPASPINPDNLFNDRPRSLPERYENDQGLGAKYMKIMRSLPMNEIGALKSGMNEKDGVDAYNIKTHPFEVGAFGHYRGIFKNSKVLILADPDGYDDFLTSRALTGSRGQYLQGLMDDMGVRENHSIIKTVPFGMENATPEEWQKVLTQTQKYREDFIRTYLNENTPDVIIADGSMAQQELSRIFGANAPAPIINIQRNSSGNSYANNSGIKEASLEIAKIPKFSHLVARLTRSNIPRKHLPYIAKTWWGTSGDRVFSALQPKFKGRAFAIVVPKWVTNQNMSLNDLEKANVQILREKLITTGLPDVKEHVPDFFARKRSLLQTSSNNQVSKITASKSLSNVCVKHY